MPNYQFPPGAGGGVPSPSSTFLSIYGDGSDGDVILPFGTTVLVRDMYYQNLTVPATSILETRNFRVFVRETCTIEGAVRCNGGTGGNGSAVTFGVRGDPGGVASGTMQALNFGGNGGFNTFGQTVPAESDCLGGQGGDGGNSVSFAGGLGGVVTPPTANEGGPRPMKSFFNFISHVLTDEGNIGDLPIAGTGGGGGGGSPASGGGGGGGGGGNIMILAQMFAGAGSIESKGGIGGNGGGTAAGGGGGGGGGVILTMSQNSPSTLTFDVSGSAGGIRVGSIVTNSNGAPGVSGMVENLVNS